MKYFNVNILIFFLLTYQLTQAQHHAIDFDGVNDFIDLGTVNATDPLSLAGSPFTISAWVNFRQSGHQYQRVVSKSDGGFAANGYDLVLQNDGDLDFYLGGQQKIVAPSTGFVPANIWTHIAVTGDGTKYRFFVNGIEVPDASITTKNAYSDPPATTTNMRIGNWNHSTGIRQFNGLMDEVRIWNIARSGPQILTDMNCKITSPRGGLIAVYNMDEGTGTTTTDHSGNNHTGTLTNGAAWTSSTASINPCPTVPTLSQWGLLILALLLMTLGTVYLLQPNSQFSRK